MNWQITEVLALVIEVVLHAVCTRCNARRDLAVQYTLQSLEGVVCTVDW
jgi:hypothetical protein